MCLGNPDTHRLGFAEIDFQVSELAICVEFLMFIYSILVGLVVYHGALCNSAQGTFSSNRHYALLYLCPSFFLLLG